MPKFNIELYSETIPSPLAGRTEVCVGAIKVIDAESKEEANKIASDQVKAMKEQNKLEHCIIGLCTPGEFIPASYLVTKVSTNNED